MIRVMKTKIVMMSMMIMIIIPIFITIIIIIIIIIMKKLMKKMISGRETQLRSPFYSPLNSMWQVRRNHHDYHDKMVIISSHSDDLIIPVIIIRLQI